MARWAWVENYSDVSPCIELIALYDDVLKKDDAFTSYAVRLAQKIADENRIKCKITWGKWGARLETTENKNLTRKRLEKIASIITSNPCWLALEVSTSIFTYGRQR